MEHNSFLQSIELKLRKMEREISELADTIDSRKSDESNGFRTMRLEAATVCIITLVERVKQSRRSLNNCKV